MKFPKPLELCQIKKRYKRFLADVIHPIHGEITVHCPNTGSMKNCWQAGWKAWILDSENPKRKYRYTWVVCENDQGDLIGVNTHYANKIVYEAIASGKIAALTDFAEIKSEVKYGEENSRIDIWLCDQNNRETFIEIKSVTLLEDDGQGYFPDAPTTRGQKHLRELIQCIDKGHRAVLFFLVQHTGIKSVAVAKHVDPEYAKLLKQAIEKGVQVLVYNTLISSDEILLDKEILFVKP